jgi:hypothetical protein
MLTVTPVTGLPNDVSRFLSGGIDAIKQLEMR